MRQEKVLGLEKNYHLDSFSGRIQFRKRCPPVRVEGGTKRQRDKNRDQVTWPLKQERMA